MKKPHIVMFVADQYRCDSIGYAGCKAAVTPNFNKLLDEGIAFNNAYSQNSVCVPSRISFMTGWYPHVKGYRTMHHLAKSDEPNLLRNLKENGYNVYWGGRNDILHEEVNQMDYCNYRTDSFGEIFKRIRNKDNLDTEILKRFKERKIKKQNGPENDMYSHYYGIMDEDNKMNTDVKEVDDAIEFIKNYDEDKPLVMYLALALPHPPYEVEQKYYDIINPDLIEEPIRLTEEQLNKKPSMMKGIRENQKLYKRSEEDLKEIKRVYLAMGTKLDNTFGKLMDAFKEKGIYDDTCVFMFSDHGDYTGDYDIAEKSQNTLENCICNVPLIVKPPKDLFGESYVSNSLVEILDIPATIYDIANIKPNHTHFGKSLVHLFNGEEEHKDAVFCEGGRTIGEEHCIDGGHKKLNEYWARTEVQGRMPHHTKAIMIRMDNYKFIYRLHEENEFYDLKKDPQERENEITNKKYENIINKMESRLLKHYVETCDVVPHKRDERT